MEKVLGTLDYQNHMSLSTLENFKSFKRQGDGRDRGSNGTPCIFYKS